MKAALAPRNAGSDFVARFFLNGVERASKVSNESPWSPHSMGFLEKAMNGVMGQSGVVWALE